jgi:PilZ domain-containing protein
MDKRAAVRVPVRARAQCRIQGVVVDGLVEDVSRSGLFMRAPRIFDAGAALELDLDLPGEATLHISAEVVRIENEPRAGMALRFVGDFERHRRPLANFIMRQYASRGLA